MPAKPYTLSDRRGKHKLRKSSDKIVTRTLKLLDTAWEMVKNEPTNKDLLFRTLQQYMELLPFLKPKLQAIALAELDATTGDLISPLRVRELATRIIEEQKLLAIAEAIE